MKYMNEGYNNQLIFLTFTVPTDGETQFVSVWCRVVRGRSDGRILATIWPLYVLHSHLPLDTEVSLIYWYDIINVKLFENIRLYGGTVLPTIIVLDSNYKFPFSLHQVLIVTDPCVSTTKDGKSEQTQLPPMLQLSPGRGSSTHLQAPGTTATRHSLSFQYKWVSYFIACFNYKCCQKMGKIPWILSISSSFSIIIITVCSCAVLIEKLMSYLSIDSIRAT